MDEYFRTNRAYWDQLVRIHVDSQGPQGYNVDDFKRGESSLHSVELEEVGDVRGKRLLHLQCHFGMDTLSWARLGAQVTGVDFSEKAIEQACSLAKDLGIEARFLTGNLYDLPQFLDEVFDIVFTSHGVINWLPDLKAWSQMIAHFLRPGGFFYVIDAHPFARVFYDEPDATDLKVWLSYWQGPGPIRLEENGDYADEEARLEHRVTYEWGHRLGEIVDSLAEAKLRIEYLHEFPFCTWKILPFTVKEDDGYYWLPGKAKNIPLLFSVKASKPLE